MSYCYLITISRLTSWLMICENCQRRYRAILLSFCKLCCVPTESACLQGTKDTTLWINIFASSRKSGWSHNCETFNGARRTMRAKTLLHAWHSLMWELTCAKLSSLLIWHIWIHLCTWMLTDGWPLPPVSRSWASLFCSKSGFITKTHFGRSLSLSPAPHFYGCEFFSVSASCNAIWATHGKQR